jgi:hypothetical protein
MLKQDLERAVKELEIDGSNTKQKVKYLLEELKRLDICLKLGSENSVSCFNYKGKNIACMSVNKYNELVRKSIKNKE